MPPRRCQRGGRRPVGGVGAGKDLASGLERLGGEDMGVGWVASSRLTYAKHCGAPAKCCLQEDDHEAV